MSLCEKCDLYVMNDEIWSDIVYPEQEFLSILSLGERAGWDASSGVFGFSKSFRIAGLRAGMILLHRQRRCLSVL